MAKTATPKPRKRKAGKTAPSRKATPSVTASFLSVHQDIAALRGELSRDRREFRASGQAMERRVHALEEADGQRNKTLIDLGIAVSNIEASIDAIHALMRGLHPDAITAIQASLARIESRQSGAPA